MIMPFSASMLSFGLTTLSQTPPSPTFALPRLRYLLGRHLQCMLTILAGLDAASGIVPYLTMPRHWEMRILHAESGYGRALDVGKEGTTGVQ